MLSMQSMHRYRKRKRKIEICHNEVHVDDTDTDIHQFMHARNIDACEYFMDYYILMSSVSNWTEEDRIRERSQEISDMCQDISDIREIFTDLAAIAESQKTTIEHIDKDMDETLDNTKKGVMHLVNASKYQGSAISLSIGMITGAIIGGPVGAIAGLKLYSFATAIGGSIAGGITTRYLDL